jgi:hypothetical protein
MSAANIPPPKCARALLCFFVFASPALAKCQLRNANWLMTNYWISFTNGAPENLPPSPYNSATASLSDTSGNLLAYFTDGSGDGITNTGVRSADHQLFASNPLFDGYFSGTSNQTTTFIPKPGDPERAYLVAWNRIPSGETHRFGLLEVFLGNAIDPPQVVSAGYNWFMIGATAKRLVIPHANGTDYWFVTQMEGTNEYHAYMITSAGLSPAPVISTAGAVLPANFNHGKLIPTVAGTRFVSVSETLNYEDPVQYPSITEVFSFDMETGAIQHQLTLGAPVRMDGVEFSPSGRFLYVRYWLFANPVLTHELYQYDLEADDPNAAPVLMDSYLTEGLSGYSTNILSQAPDGRIYVSHYTPSMGVISAPDLPFPQCDYVHDGFLATSAPPCLPSFIKRYNDPPPVGPMVINGRITAAQAVVMPNPLCGTGELRRAGASGAVDLHWMDVQGRVLRYETRTAQGDRVMLDARGFAAGQYLLRVEPRNETPTVLRVSVAD